LKPQNSQKEQNFECNLFILCFNIICRKSNCPETSFILEKRCVKRCFKR